jgi:hypothetical protein
VAEVLAPPEVPGDVALMPGFVEGFLSSPVTDGMVVQLTVRTIMQITVAICTILDGVERVVLISSFSPTYYRLASACVVVFECCNMVRMVMEEVNRIIRCLELSPHILDGLIKETPTHFLKLERVQNRWTIHKHACHVAVGEKYSFHKRFKAFQDKDQPCFTPISGDDFSKEFYEKMDIDAASKEFHLNRKTTIEMTKDLPISFWEKEAVHPEYTKYTPFIMLRHLLMHDHLHFYSIEELMLTNDQYLDNT